MSLDKGYYKLKLKNKYGKDNYHYLRVEIINGKKTFLLDNGLAQESTDYERYLEQEFEVIRKITIHQPIQVNNPKITLEWKDEDGHSISMTCSNIYGFVRMLELYPRICDGLWMNRKTLQEIAEVVQKQ
ncbi:MAG: hypothetical protein JXQ90_23165 [Cyclobacteriaceae bacterium]